MMRLIECQNYLSTTVTMPSYHDFYLYGNEFYFVNSGQTGTPIYYGGGENSYPLNRKGILYFYNNTIVNQDDQSHEYSFTVFDLSDPAETLDARNNIIYNVAKTPGQPLPIMDLLPTHGNAYFGSNWISPGYFVSKASWISGTTETGNVAGLSQTITNPQNDPGFVSVNVNSPDFHLTGSSPAIHAATILSANDPFVLVQYLDPNSGKPIATVWILGAYQYSN